MQLGKKSKTTDMYERVKGDFNAQTAQNSPLISSSPSATTAETASFAHVPTSSDQDAIQITIVESISAKFSRDGLLKSFNVKGDLQLRISDPSLTKVKLDLVANPTNNAQFRTHPNVDKGHFSRSKTIQLRDELKGFPVNNSVGVLRWSTSAISGENNEVPITFTVWVNKGSDEFCNITVEYELTGGDSLRDVSLTIPYGDHEPIISSFDAIYEVSGDSLEWVIGTIGTDEANASGNFEFEAQVEDESVFFPMSVRFSKSKPFVDVDVSHFQTHSVLC